MFNVSARVNHQKWLSLFDSRHLSMDGGGGAGSNKVIPCVLGFKEWHTRR